MFNLFEVLVVEEVDAEVLLEVLVDGSVARGELVEKLFGVLRRRRRRFEFGFRVGLGVGHVDGAGAVLVEVHDELLLLLLRRLLEHFVGHRRILTRGRSRRHFKALDELTT